MSSRLNGTLVRGLVTFSCKVKDIVRFFAFYGENWCFFLTFAN